MTDPALLADCFEAHAPALVLYARQWLADRAWAEDVVQDVFIRMSAQPVAPANARAWLYASVRNAAIDEARSANRRKRREASAATSRRERWFEHGPNDLIDAEAVERALATLPPRQREVVTLRIWSEMRLGQIAAIMGIAISTVHDEYRRGLERIRAAMEKPCTTTTTNETT
jgi:RNA polymerase sigma-70 factor (ECF subfamily)